LKNFACRFSAAFKLLKADRKDKNQRLCHAERSEASPALVFIFTFFWLPTNRSKAKLCQLIHTFENNE
jgi:hypothetical protein